MKSFFYFPQVRLVACSSSHTDFIYWSIVAHSPFSSSPQHTHSTHSLSQRHGWPHTWLLNLNVDEFILWEPLAARRNLYQANLFAFYFPVLISSAALSYAINNFNKALLTCVFPVHITQLCMNECSCATSVQLGFFFLWFTHVPHKATISPVPWGVIYIPEAVLSFPAAVLFPVISASAHMWKSSTSRRLCTL